MSMTKIYANKKICDTLQSYAQQYGLSGSCCFQETTDASNNVTLHWKDQKKIFTTPVRLGEILDQLASYKAKAQNHATLPQFAGYTLDPHQGTFTNDHKTITLTEKEVEILVHLYENKGKIVSREALLHAVWNYAQGVETHTLETHIYRLRQKIEENPTHPTILITEEDGYRV